MHPARCQARRLFWVSTRNYHKGSAANILPLSTKTSTKNIQWQVHHRNAAFGCWNSTSFCFPGVALSFYHWEDLGRELLLGSGELKSGDRNHRGKRMRLLSPGGDYHKGWTHMSLRSEVRGMRARWKLDKYSEFSCFQFYFSVVEPSRKQTKT